MAGIGESGIRPLTLTRGRGPESLDLLEYLGTQHVTQLSVCELLAKLAADHDNVTARHDAAAVVDCFAEWLPVHEAIEERHLLGLVGQRSLPGDDFEAKLAQLRLGHEESRILADELMGGLHDIATGRSLKDPDGFRATAIALCSHHRAVVHWEDDVLYPFVRRRLNVADLDLLAAAIACGHPSGVKANRRDEIGNETLTRPKHH